MHPLREKYSRELLQEMIDLMNIAPNNNESWKQFAYKRGIVKKTTKTIRVRISSFNRRHEYKQIGDAIERIDYDMPKKQIVIILKNGSGREVFRADFLQEDIPKLLEESL